MRTLTAARVRSGRSCLHAEANAPGGGPIRSDVEAEPTRAAILGPSDEARSEVRRAVRFRTAALAADGLYEA
jgi:hypothetical protein